MTAESGYFSNVSEFSIGDLYEKTYFAAEETATGYTTYQDGAWAERLALVTREFFAPRHVVEIGCARGYVVGHLRAAGINALGFDYSHHALATAPAAVHGRIGRADASRLPLIAQSCDVLLSFETLEHLHPQHIPRTAAEFARCARDWVVLTIPTYGDDEPGRVGIPIEDAEHAVDAREGRAFRKLVLDARGQPDLGHLTLATWRWWSAQFAAAGLRRAHEIEAVLLQHPFASDSLATWYWHVFTPHPERRVGVAPGASVVMNDTPIWQLGAGWHPIEGHAPDAFRWSQAQAHLSIPADGARLVLMAAGGPRQVALDLTVDDQPCGRRHIAAGWAPQRSVWRIPPGAGLRQITLGVPTGQALHDARGALGAMVWSVTIEKES